MDSHRDPVQRPEDAHQRLRLETVAARLRIDAAAAEASAALAAAGVDSRLLKGAAVAQWLYAASGGRGYSDCDLLVAPGDVPAAQRVLSSLGYAPDFDDSAMPVWWQEHGRAWCRSADAVTIDLHRLLPGVRVDAESAWRLLSADPAPVLAGGRLLPALGLPARLLHVVLHAAQHGSPSGTPIADLERAMAQLDPDAWRAAAALARAVDATDAFAAGLGLASGGSELARSLGIPPASSVEALLRAGSAVPGALAFEQFARADGMRARASIVFRKLVPPPEYVRYWSRQPGGGRSELLKAYLRRPLWVARQALGGLRAWRDGRRSAAAARTSSGSERDPR
ncbi:MAG: nucleotidyltransferase family protein [Solirubrobacteraceae bacterium]